MRNKRSRLPARTSELDLQSSEKLNLSRAQIMRRRKITLEVLRPVHCGMKKILVLDGMWTTLINTAPKKCMAEYIRMSKTCTQIVQQIVQTNIHEYENTKKQSEKYACFIRRSPYQQKEVHQYSEYFRCSKGKCKKI